MESSRIKINIDDEIRIGIKAPDFFSGYAVVVCAIAAASLGGIYIGFEILNRNGYAMPLLFLFLGLGVIICTGWWILYVLADEVIVIQSGSFSRKRGIGPFFSQRKDIVWDGFVDIYFKRTEAPDSFGFRQRGVLLLSNGEQEFDFGISLNQEEIAQILPILKEALNQQKRDPNESVPIQD